MHLVAFSLGGDRTAVTEFPSPSRNVGMGTVSIDGIDSEPSQDSRSMARIVDRGTSPLVRPAFIIYVTAVLTVVMLLFPPFVSLSGTEYAFLLTGPEWSRAMGAFGEEVGLTARVHWEALIVQLGALWAIGLGARWFLT